MLQLGPREWCLSPAHVNWNRFLCNLLSFSGTEIQLGSVCQQALPGPGEDCEEQQEGGPDQSQNTRLERCHGTRRGLLWCSRRVQHGLVRKVALDMTRSNVLVLCPLSPLPLWFVHFTGMLCTLIIFGIFSRIHLKHFWYWANRLRQHFQQHDPHYWEAFTSWIRTFCLGSLFKLWVMDYGWSWLN